MDMKFRKKNFGKKTQVHEKKAETVAFEREPFGRCVFERDPAGDMLRLADGISPGSFGKHEDLDIEMEVPEGRVDEAFRCLERAYENPEWFLGKFYEGVRLFCEEWEETDSDGKEITTEMIERNCGLYQIQVQESYKGRIVVLFSGMISDDRGNDLLGCHSVIAQFDGETGEVEYGLEG
jgi:hypothetical protein